MKLAPPVHSSCLDVVECHREGSDATAWTWPFFSKLQDQRHPQQGKCPSLSTEKTWPGCEEKEGKRDPCLAPFLSPSLSSVVFDGSAWHRERQPQMLEHVQAPLWPSVSLSVSPG